jgi:GTPase SAR1 family protein
LPSAFLKAEQSELNLNIVLVGDKGVGKPSFCARLATGGFENRYNATNGVDAYVLRPIITTGGRAITITLLDTSGQDVQEGIFFDRIEGFGVIHACIIMYDIASTTTLKNSKVRYLIMRSVQGFWGNIPIAFVGNKCDLPAEMHKVTPERIETTLRAVFRMDPHRAANFLISVQEEISIREPLEWLLNFMLEKVSDHLDPKKDPSHPDPSMLMNMMFMSQPQSNSDDYGRLNSKISYLEDRVDMVERKMKRMQDEFEDEISKIKKSKSE